MSNVRAAMAVIAGLAILAVLPKAVDLVASVASNMVGVIIAFAVLLVTVYGVLCVLMADER